MLYEDISNTEGQIINEIFLYLVDNQEINSEELPALNNDYLWVNYATLNKLVEANNILNIQLRNLMSLVSLEEVKKEAIV